MASHRSNLDSYYIRAYRDNIIQLSKQVKQYRIWKEHTMACSSAFIKAGDVVINQYEIAMVQKRKTGVLVTMKSGETVALTDMDAALFWTKLNAFCQKPDY